MGWFDKHCEKCGVQVDKKIATQRFGKYFCSDEHAQTYAKDVEEMRKKMPQQKSSGGCC